MGKKLAIQGHTTRGKEVIEILEMLGGVAGSSKGFMESYCYYVPENIGSNYISWDYIGPEEIDKYKIFTLEEFLEKYPYKVGDLKDREVDSISCIIDKMRWNSNKECIEYHGSFGKNDYGWHRAEDFRIYDSFPNIFSQKFKTTEISFNEKVCKPEVELKLGNYEIEVRDGKTYAVLKKLKYPTTYEECCKNAFGLAHGGMTVDVPMHYSPLIINFTKLLICRDAYWKIAGKEMGLDGAWEPDWNDLNRKYFISLTCDGIGLYDDFRNPQILVFPTPEMRDAFYENFKDLIEQCKELL